MNNLVKQSQVIAYEEQEKTGMPLRQHIDLSTSVGKRLAEKLNADVNIVETGTLLMDCLIGKAINEKRLQDHVDMSLDRTNEMLIENDVSEEIKENIRHCVSEHHGVSKYHSLESEICANADCYRFISVEGFISAIRYLRDMPFNDLITLLDNKVEEKWGVLSLDICKEELEPQYKTIRSIIDNLIS